MGGQGQDQFGGDDVNDVVNLIPLLKSLPEVDPNRIGIVGGSRGGMMAYMTLRKQTLAGTNDIKVAVIVSGCADLFFAAKNQPDMLISVFIPLIGGTPEQLPKEYEARSAVYWANDINVPILIQHGDQDIHVYIDEANKMAEELKKYGKTYKYIVYPGRGHDLDVTGRDGVDQLTWLKNYLQ
jgi:dipeptidyl aminopeptidase/acylaminoacyl peptidase